MDDSALIEAYRQGDQSALGTLLTRHQGMLFNTALRMVSNRDDAMEVAQEAMLKIVQHIDNFREDARFTTWATRIAMNCAISRLRRRKIRRTQSLDAPMGHDPSAGSMVANLANPAEPGPAERVQHSDRLDLVRRAIDELEEPFRSVLVLRDVQGLEYEEIAQVLEIAKGTVKSRLFRARLAMRQIVRKYDPDVPDEPNDAARPVPKNTG